MAARRRQNVRVEAGKVELYFADKADDRWNWVRRTAICSATLVFEQRTALDQRQALEATKLIAIDQHDIEMLSTRSAVGARPAGGAEPSSARPPTS